MNHVEMVHIQRILRPHVSSFVWSQVDRRPSGWVARVIWLDGSSQAVHTIHEARKAIANR